MDEELGHECFGSHSSAKKKIVLNKELINIDSLFDENHLKAE